ncbi:caldesmon-like [Panicum hallii]|nr:caldesmon-like [Panicum hallii]
MAAGRQAPAAAENVDPVYEWLDDGDSYLLRLNLPEFKKEDFRVHVDGEGRLTIIGQRRPAPGAGGEAKAMRLHKAFQLPNTVNLDAVSGRFDGTVLTVRVPKLQQGQGGEEQVADGGKPPADQEDKAGRASLTGRGKEEDDKAKPVAPPPPSQQQQQQQQPREEKVARGGDHRDDQDEKARAEHGEKVAREAARRVEAARARVAEAKAKAEQERQREHWKERAVEEGLKLADAVSKNKEVIAAAVAAFTLVVFVSHKLFSRS